MDMVCYTCGGRDHASKPVVCNKCEGFSVHRYCMKVFVSKGEIEWFCEYCEANTDPWKRCKRAIKYIKISKFCTKRKRYRDEEFCQNDENYVPEGRGENVTIPTTSLGSNSQDWSKKELKENSGVKVDVKQRKERVRYVDNYNEHATMEEREPSFKIKMDCYKKWEKVEKEASVGGTFCEGTQGDNVETDEVAPKEKLYIPSCYPKRDCMGNGRNFSEIQAGRSEQNISLVRAELAAGDAQVVALEKRNLLSFFQSVTVNSVLRPRNAYAVDRVHRPGDACDVRNCVWKEYFIYGTHRVPLEGHTSSMTHVKYKDVSKFLPEVISLKKTSCPARFDTRDLTHHDVDLFFLPLDSRTEGVIDGIMHDMINENYVLKFKIDDTELHIFSSSPSHLKGFKGDPTCGVYSAQHHEEVMPRHLNVGSFDFLRKNLIC